MEIEINKTNEIRALQEIGNIIELSRTGDRDVESRSKDAHKLFWFGETSPKLKIQLLGTEALKLFQASELAQNFIADMKALYGQEYTKLGIPNGYTVDWSKGDGSGVIEGEYLPIES